MWTIKTGELTARPLLDVLICSRIQQIGAGHRFDQVGARRPSRVQQGFLDR